MKGEYFSIKGKVAIPINEGFESMLHTILKHLKEEIIIEMKGKMKIYFGINLANPEEYYLSNDIKAIKWLIIDSGRNNTNDIFYISKTTELYEYEDIL